jgi:hypothetical protein
MPSPSTDEPPKGSKSPNNGNIAKKPSFSGALHASTTSAWSLGLPFRAHPPLPLSTLAPSGLSSLPRGNAIPETTAASSSKMKEISGDVLNEVAHDLRALTSDIDILRIYVSLDEIPFALLDALQVHLRDLSLSVEVHVCIQSLLRPALQQVYENLGLERGLVSTIRKWQTLGTTLKFFFLRPDVPLHTDLEVYSNHQQVDLLPAIIGLAKGPLELPSVRVPAQGDRSNVSGYTDGTYGDGNAMDLDHDF